MPATPFAYLAAGTVAVALVLGGCAKGSDQSTQSTTSTTTTQTAASPAAAIGDAGHGKQIYAANCAACHGATGVEGGVGPSLKGEKARKNDAETIAWIHDPKPPMPKLWPSPLNDKDVADVAAYVQTL
jgi:mono/diheme cytochrome c family protein